MYANVIQITAPAIAGPTQSSEVQATEAIMRPTRFRLLSTALCTSFLLAACGGGSGDSAGTGNLTLGITDAPVDSAKEVVVAFTGVEVKPADGPALDPFLFDEDSCDSWDDATGTCSINLLDVTGTDRRIIISEELEAGDYEWIRLLVDADRNEIDSYLLTDGDAQCSLWVPSGAQTGLKLVSGFTVPANGVTDYTLDFDLRKSVVNPPGLTAPDVVDCADDYLLKPVIRIIDNTQVGAIAGTVDATQGSVLEQNCSTNNSGVYENVAVYVFDESEGTVVPDDIDTTDETDVDPVTTADVEWNADEGIYEYTAGFLVAPGTYRVALTCTADLDDAEMDDYPSDTTDAPVFDFIAEQPVNVEVNTTSDGSF
jgi:hypothetical protein